MLSIFKAKKSPVYRTSAFLKSSSYFRTQDELITKTDANSFDKGNQGLSKGVRPVGDLQFQVGKVFILEFDELHIFLATFQSAQ